MPIIGLAQDYSNAWEGMFSFFNIKDVAATDNQVYAASENAIFITDLNSGDQKEVSTVEGLSGEKISVLSYIEETHALLIGFENGLIQLYDLDSKSFKTFNDIIQKPTITPDERKINAFYVLDNKAFIAANYGVSELNLNKKEFGDTYYIGISGEKIAVNDVTVLNHQIYAATESEGIRYADLENKSIVNHNEWNKIDDGTFKHIVSLNNQLLVTKNENELFQINENSSITPVYQYNQTVNDLKVDNGILTAALRNQTVLLNEDLNFVLNYTTNEIDADFNTAISHNGHLFLGDKKYGLIQSTIDNTSYTEFISPNGPLRNDVFSMDAIPHEIWLSYGEHDFNYNPYPIKKRGISHYNSEQWFNFPYENLPDQAALTDVKINPNNPSQVYFASYSDGLLEMYDNEVSQSYTTHNTNLNPMSGSSRDDELRLGPMEFDSNGNLWFTASRSDYGLIKFAKEAGPDDFENIDISNTINNPTSNGAYSSMVIDDQNNVYIGTWKEGVVGYNSESNNFAKVKGNEGQGNLPSNHITALGLDHNNQLWIGTTVGLRVLHGPSEMFTNSNVKTRNIVFKGSDGINQELFAGSSISTIEIDGSNNKWVGTTAGSYYVSSDGQETIHHFTKDNSPLPSNNITDIKVDGETGKVYMATDKGLVAFKGKATTAQDDLEHVRAYPNPVRPNYNGEVTIDGLMKKSNVKITDIEGNLVYEEVSEGGSIQWDTTAFGKYKVASGVYMVLITSDKQEKTKVTKIMVIR